MKTRVLREEVIRELHKLPADRLREVYDFVGFLQSKQEPSVPDQPEPQSDPILRLMGAVEVEPFSVPKDYGTRTSFAHRIDEELYGS